MSTGLAVAVLECPSVPEVAGFHAMLGARVTRMDSSVERRLHVSIGGGELLYIERRGAESTRSGARPASVCILGAVSPQALYLDFARRMKSSCGEVFSDGAPALVAEGVDAGERYPGIALVDPAGNLIRFVRPGYFDRFRSRVGERAASA